MLFPATPRADRFFDAATRTIQCRELYRTERSWTAALGNTFSGVEFTSHPTTRSAALARNAQFHFW
jgi:hypothetical protein